MSSNAAIGAPADPASAVNPGGADSTESPWLIHTASSSGRPCSSVPGTSTRALVRPNSLSPVRATSPPSAEAMAWKP